METSCAHWPIMARQYGQEAARVIRNANLPHAHPRAAISYRKEADRLMRLINAGHQWCLDCYFSDRRGTYLLGLGSWTEIQLTIHGANIIRLLVMHVCGRVKCHMSCGRLNQNNVFYNVLSDNIYTSKPGIYEGEESDLISFEFQNLRDLIFEVCGGHFNVPQDVQHLLSLLPREQNWSLYESVFLRHPCLLHFSETEDIIKSLNNADDVAVELAALAGQIDLALPGTHITWSSYWASVLVERDAPPYFLRCLHYNVTQPDEGDHDEIRFLDENVGILKYANNLIAHGAEYAGGETFDKQRTLDIIIKLAFPGFFCELITRLYTSEDPRLANLMR